MTVQLETRSQAELYDFNRARLSNPSLNLAQPLSFEKAWIDSYLNRITENLPPSNLSGLLACLDELVADEEAHPPESSMYVATRMTREEFAVLVQEFAVDGLTEAQVFYFILPRLSLEAQMPMLRIMIDEFGSGNLQRAHTTLYQELLRELHMPLDVSHYCGRIDSTSFEFVNLFFWLTLRAEDPSCFAGAITYLESSIPSFFECYVQACHRLDIAAHAYYSEHQHIDAFHALEGRRLLRAMSAGGTLNVASAWQGIHLASRVTSRAFEGAVAKARRFEVAGHTSSCEGSS